MLSLLDAARQSRRIAAPSAVMALESAEPFQLTALAVFMSLGSEEQPLLTWLQSRRPYEYGIALAATTSVDAPGDPWTRVWKSTRRYEDIAASELVALACSLTKGTVDRDRLAAWLALCTHFGMTEATTDRLATTLADSGLRLDARELMDEEVQLVRRYPTGSISEKVALTLPPLIALARTRLGIASPVIVARSLGFAGGTWDKLSTLPGFRFADLESVPVELENTGVAYIVPQSLCPADRELYAFRGATGTVDCPELIIASIAAKHIALPVDHLLLDIQMGPGGYMRDAAEAQRTAEGVRRLAMAVDMRVSHTTREAAWLTGTCIGAGVEMWEALATLGASGEAYASLDARGLERQREVTAAVFASLVTESGTATDSQAEHSWALAQMRNGAALAAARRIYIQHGVPESTFEALAQNPPCELGFAANRAIVRARSSGRVVALDIRALGRAGNLALGAGGNDYLDTPRRVGGLQLRFLPGDYVEADDPLVYCWSDASMDPHSYWQLEAAVGAAISIQEP